MKTHLPKPDMQRRSWRIIDANGAILGRLAVQVADVLRGRDKPTFTPHLDAGDFVVVINAEKVVLSGNKESDKRYMTYSGWKGGKNIARLRRFVPVNLSGLSSTPSRGCFPKTAWRTA